MSVNFEVNLQIAQAGLDSISGEGKGGKGVSWLVAIAQAMGSILGEKAQKLNDLSEKLNGLTGKDDAQKFSATQTEFQAESQMFNMLSNTISTAIKSIGEGLAANARKQ